MRPQHFLLVIIFSLIFRDGISQRTITINGILESTSTIKASGLQTPHLEVAESLTIEPKGIVNKIAIEKSAETTQLITDEIVAIESHINVDGSIFVQSIEANEAEASSFILLGEKQWQLHNHDDFDSPSSLEGWSFNKTSTCDQLHQDNRFLGGHCLLSYTEISKTFPNLPPHQNIRVNGNVHMFDKWDDEVLYVKVDGAVVFQTTGKSSKHAGGLDICGGAAADPKFNHPIDIILRHSKQNLTLTFGTTLQKDACEASYAVDNVMLYLK